MLRRFLILVGVSVELTVTVTLDFKEASFQSIYIREQRILMRFKFRKGLGTSKRIRSLERILNFQVL